MREKLSIITLYKLLHNIEPTDHISPFYFKQLKITLELENPNVSLNNICSDSDFTSTQKKEAIKRHTKKDDKSSLAGLINRVLQIKNFHRLSLSKYDRLSVLSCLKQSYVGHIDSLILNMEFEEEDKLKRLVADVESEFEKGLCFDAVFIRFLNCLRAYDCNHSFLISQIRSFFIQQDDPLFCCENAQNVLFKITQVNYFNHYDIAVINFLISFNEATINHFGFEAGLDKALNNMQILSDQPGCNELFDPDFLKTILAFNLFLFLIRKPSSEDAAPKLIKKLCHYMSSSSPVSNLNQEVLILFEILLTHNKESILKSIALLLSSSNSLEKTMGEDCIYLILKTQSSAQYITDVLEEKMTFTNRSILLQELFNYKHKQRKCLTVDEFDAYQKNKFAYSYRLKFVEKYESLFTADQLVSQVNSIVRFVELDDVTKSSIEDIIKRISGLVNLCENEKDKMLNRLKDRLSIPTVSDLNAMQSVDLNPPNSFDKKSGDDIPVNIEKSLCYTLMGCFSRRFRQVFP